MRRVVLPLLYSFIAFFLFLGCWLYSPCLLAQTTVSSTDSVVKSIVSIITPTVKEQLYIPIPSCHRFVLHSSLDSILINTEDSVIEIYSSEGLASRNFTPTDISDIYHRVKESLPDYLSRYRARIYSCGKEISEYVPNYLREKKDLSRMWNNRDYQGVPWVKNISRPFRITNGLQNRHLTLWASHGKYWQNSSQCWEWQRPSLYCTTEDMFTLSFVTPFLLPMLENSGAVCFTPRERDWQLNEVIVDNDSISSGFQERSYVHYWQPSPIEGFRNAHTSYYTGESPFHAMKRGFVYSSDTTTTENFMSSVQDTLIKGTALWTETVTSGEQESSCCWMPTLNCEGDYAVYVTYQSFPESTDDAVYKIVHQGIETQIRVNQTMGGGTWVYLGTFRFDKGCSARNAVFLTNQAEVAGKIVSADAVRFGGGQGNIMREENGEEGRCSGLPRFLEGARYYTQYAGFPSDVYNTKDGHNDYSDDINSRSNAVNWLAGGSIYYPSTKGKHVPIELSLALHSDAGYTHDNSTIGTLVINTLQNDTLGEFFSSGLHRMASSDFADILQNTIARDFSSVLDRTVWYMRDHYRRNYSESRKPEIPSAILEMLSHQNFTDMLLGHDSNFKFLFARSIYKAILKFVSSQHGKEYVVQPLPVVDFAAVLQSSGFVRLSWTPQHDAMEKTAAPTGYIVYTQSGDSGFDNGVFVNNATEYMVKIESDKMYRFKVTAVNSGGESFPSEILAVYRSSHSEQETLIVNGFTRLSSPAVISTTEEQGFCLEQDYGVPYIQTPEYCGEQLVRQKKNIGEEGKNALGYSAQDMVGKFVKGNTFDYPSIHGSALVAYGGISFSSCSMSAIEKKKVSMMAYNMLDIIFGLQKDCGISSICSYKTFSSAFRKQLKHYLENQGKVFVSGAYIGSDMNSSQDADFTSKFLGYAYTNSVDSLSSYIIYGEGIKVDYEHTYNQPTYAVQHPDRICSTSFSLPILFFPDSTTAGVFLQNGNSRVICMTVPFESIKEQKQRNILMKNMIEILSK